MHKLYQFPAYTEGAVLALKSVDSYNLCTIQAPHTIPVQYRRNWDMRIKVCSTCSYRTDLTYAIDEHKKAFANGGEKNFVQNCRNNKWCTSAPAPLGTSQCYTHPNFSEYQTVELRVPRLVIKLSTFTIDKVKKEEWRLLGLSTDELLSAPYRVGNVTASGRVCWGKSNGVTIADHLDLYTKFFTYPFNDDFAQFPPSDVPDGLTHLEMYDHDASIQESEGPTPTSHLLRPYDCLFIAARRNPQRPLKGMIVSNNPQFVESIPAAYRYTFKKADGYGQIAVGFIYAAKNGWLISFKDYWTVLTSKNLKITNKTKLIHLGDKNEIL